MGYFLSCIFGIFFTILLASSCNSTEHIVSCPLLTDLLNDMQRYKFDAQGDLYLHAGDLYEHSIWTYNAMVQLCADNSPYTHDLTLNGRQQEVIACAALLHDIGKAGRKELFDHTHPTLYYDIKRDNQETIDTIIYYQDHQEHPLIGFAYIQGHKHYYMANHHHNALSLFDFDVLFDQLGITLEEQKIIAILIGIHYEFGNLRHNKITSEQFLDKLETLVKVADYNSGNLDELIVRLAILVQVADVKGLTPVGAQKTPLFPHGISCHAVHTPTLFSDAFTSLGYTLHDTCCSKEPLAVTKMHELMATFYKRSITDLATLQLPLV